MFGQPHYAFVWCWPDLLWSIPKSCSHGKCRCRKVHRILSISFREKFNSERASRTSPRQAPHSHASSRQSGSKSQFFKALSAMSLCLPADSSEEAGWESWWGRASVAFTRSVGALTRFLHFVSLLKRRESSAPPSILPLWTCKRLMTQSIVMLSRWSCVPTHQQAIASASHPRGAVRACVRVSEEFTITTGVRQGDVLAPTMSVSSFLWCSNSHTHTHVGARTCTHAHQLSHTIVYILPVAIHTHSSS